MIDRVDSVRRVVDWVSKEANALPGGFKQWEKLNPSQAELFWARWEKFDGECMAFINAEIDTPVIREAYTELIVILQ